MKIGIAGAGLVGRLLAWHLKQHGCEVALFSKDGMAAEHSCSAMAAGMISPMAELPILPTAWHAMAQDALTWWPKILTSLSLPVYYQARGSIVLSHSKDKSLLMHFIAAIGKNIAPLMGSELHTLESELNPALCGCYLPHEAHIDAGQLMQALGGNLTHPYHVVNKLTSKSIETNKGTFYFDKIIDCRGLGSDFPGLRGVRGELIYCHAPHVHIQRPLRLLHARFPCYIVPRQNHHYIIGATQIESEATDPISVKSTLQLLSAATSVHSGFYDANIIHMKTGCRPTSLNHVPFILERKGVTHVNGMFRHGFLLAPSLLAQLAQNLVNNES